MIQLTVTEQITIFGRYIGQQVMINSCVTDEYPQIGILKGIKQDGLMVEIEEVKRWVPLTDEIELNKVKLLLKPLKKLTPEIIKTANSLPVQAFITPYYQGLGFDMPVFLSPGHPANCLYVEETGLADYRTAHEIMESQLVLI